MSAFYYAGNFFSRDVLENRFTDIYFKAFKYLAAIIFSLVFILVCRSVKLLFAYSIIIFFDKRTAAVVWWLRGDKIY